MKEPNKNRWFYGQFLNVSDCQRTAVIYQYWFSDNRWVVHIYQEDNQWVSVPHLKNHPTLVRTWTNIVRVLILLVETANCGRFIHFSWNLLRWQIMQYTEETPTYVPLSILALSLPIKGWMVCGQKTIFNWVLVYILTNRGGYLSLCFCYLLTIQLAPSLTRPRCTGK
jgi:hypothetical protein